MPARDHIGYSFIIIIKYYCKTVKSESRYFIEFDSMVPLEWPPFFMIIALAPRCTHKATGINVRALVLSKYSTVQYNTKPLFIHHECLSVSTCGVVYIRTKQC